MDATEINSSNLSIQPVKLVTNGANVGSTFDLSIETIMTLPMMRIIQSPTSNVMTASASLGAFISGYMGRQNHIRPHSSNGYIPAAKFEKLRLDQLK